MEDCLTGMAIVCRSALHCFFRSEIQLRTPEGVDQIQYCRVRPHSHTGTLDRHVKGRREGRGYDQSDDTIHRHGSVRPQTLGKQRGDLWKEPPEEHLMH